MTTKQQAFELVRDMYSVDASNPSEYGMEWDMAKECALISVDRILDTLKSCWDEQGALNMYNYYYLVKQEIEKL